MYPFSFIPLISLEVKMKKGNKNTFYSKCKLWKNVFFSLMEEFSVETINRHNYRLGPSVCGIF